MQRTIPKVRGVRNNSQKTKELLQDIADRLKDHHLKQKAVKELEKLLFVDGVVPLEEEFLGEVKAVMGI